MMNLMASAAERRRLERFSRKSEGPVELFPRPWATAMAPHGRWLLANFHLRKPPPKKFRRSRALIISLTLSRCRHLAPLPLQFPPSSPAFPSLLLSPLVMLGGGGVGGGKKPPPRGVHPRYVPKRGSVLKGIVRRMLGLFVFLLPQQGGGGAANGSGGGGRVRPAAPPVDDGGEQGK